MGSKKHKKESKKKKHRSRSRSPLEGEERERKRHRKHKDRKKDRSPDVEEVPVDSHLVKDTELSLSTASSAEREYDREHAPDRERERVREHAPEREREREHAPERERERDREHAPQREREHAPERERDREHAPQRERERDRRAREARSHRDKDDLAGYILERERERSRSESPPPGPAASGSGATSSVGAQQSLSVEQANRLRAKLGLKPLELTEKTVGDDGKLKDDLGEFYHAPAVNLAAQRRSDKMREKLDERREKRKMEQKFQSALLGEGSDEDAAAWVRKSREIDQQKREADKRAALLDEMDAVFGVSALVAAEQRAERGAAYAPQHLRGLRVAHDLDALGEESVTVLTLADQPVLADAEDVLVNVNMVDDEKYRKNIEERKKAKAGYQAYDDEELEAAALGFQRPVLAKYDDEIDEGRAARQRGFVIGDEDAAEARRFRDMMRQERLSGGVHKRLESLRLPALRPASDYLDEHELQAKFKKTKKRGKMRKKAKQEPIDVDDYDAGAAPLDTDDTDVQPEQLSAALPVDDEEVEPDSELQEALARARRLRAAPRAPAAAPQMEELLQSVKEEQPAADEEPGAMVLDATAEFCRTLGDIPTYGQAGNRDHLAEIMELEQEELEPEPEPERNAGAWSRVDLRSEKPPDLAAGGAGGLQAEPALGAGVAGALQLALSKGYLERAGDAPAPRAPAALQLLSAKNYSIEDKSYGGEDDKHGRRERGGAHGPLQDFREKAHFRPNIKLEYADDEGRPLCPKEAFRYLSHKFHGKGPGKNKQEKRIKKAVQEGLMKKMSSTDTPLNTLQMLQDKQRETHSPYIVLSGAKRDAQH